jgi:hypothetical protein
VDSSSLANCKDNGWLNSVASNVKGGNEWGVLVNFSLFDCFPGIDLSLET